MISQGRGMALDFVKEMVEARRCLHKRPEEGWTEFETTWFIVRRLKALGLQVTIGKANICESEVLGRDPVLVSDAMKRAAAHGVPEDFLKATEGYTGAVARFDTGRARSNHGFQK